MSDEHYLKLELEAEMQRDPALFEFLRSASLDGLWYWDLQNPEHEYMSPEFWRLFGIDPAKKSHLAAEWQDIIHPDDLETALENFNRHLEDPSHPYDQIVRYRHADGGTVTVRCRGIAIRDANGTAVRMLGAHNDLTDLKQAEEQLAAANDALRQQVMRAEAASDAKTRFLSNVSHELRTPLNAVLGLSEALLLTEQTQEQHAMTQALRESGRQLLGLIDEFIDVNRIEAGTAQLNRTPLDLDAFCEGIRLAHDPQARASGLVWDVTLTKGTERAVAGDHKVLRQIADNLVGNALKYTDAGRVTLALKVREEKAAPRLTITVTDTGPGIPKDEQDGIFARFQRGSSQEDRVDEGLGLGLALVRGLTELHHGSVALDQAYLDGSRFVADVGLAWESDAPTEPVTKPEHLMEALGPLAILIAEDNDMNRFVLDAYFEGSNVCPTYVANGQEALEALRSGTYDLGVIDIRMPVMDGVSFKKAYDQDVVAGRSASIPMVSYSANALPEQLAQYKHLGYRAHLTKPSTPGQMVSVFAQALGREAPVS